jgi:hypothetical protein
MRYCDICQLTRAIDAPLLRKHLDQLDELERYSARHRRTGPTWDQGLYVQFFRPGHGNTYGVAIKQRAGTYLLADGLSWPELACGTACCIAGAVALEHAPPETVFTESFYLTTPDHPRESIRVYAARILGLCWCQADELFDAYNTRRQLRAIAERMIRTQEMAGD